MSTNERCEVSASTATLPDYNTAEPIRAATDDELQASVPAAEHDGGAGVITVPDQGDHRCYVA